MAREPRTYTVKFKSGKKVDLKKCTGYKKNDEEWFTRKDGTKFQAPGYVYFFGAGKGIVHYQVSKVSNPDA